MLGTVILGRRLAVAAALVGLAAAPAAAAMMVFDCLSQPNAKSCAVTNAQLTVEVVDAGGGQVGFVIANEDAGKLIVEQVYVDDERGTLVGPPEILNNEGTVVFERISERIQLTGAAGARPPFRGIPDLSVKAAQPSDVLGINPGESLGLVFAIASGRSVADVIDDLSTGHLRFGVSTVAVSGGGHGSLVSQLLVSDVE